MIKISPFLRKIIFLVSILGSICLIIISLKNALIFSQDFQRSGAKALSLGLNPYDEFLSGDIKKIFIKSQAPNYFQTLYFLFLPFTLISNTAANLIWGILNLIMLFTSTFILGKIYKIRNKLSLLLIFFVLISGFPARNVIGNGQLSIFILNFFLIGIFIQEKLDKSQKNSFGMFLYGFSYLKYSFAPAFGMFNLIKYGLKNFLITLIPSLLGVVAMALFFRSYSSIFGPFKVSSITMANSFGIGDLLSILTIFFQAEDGIIRYLLILICLSLSLLFVLKTTTLNLERQIPLVSLISIMFVNHLGYDYVFYITPLVFAFSSFSNKLEKFTIFFNWTIIGHGIWILNKNNFNLNNIQFISFIFFLNFILFLVIYISGSKNKYKLFRN